ncbi:hypothetical protein FRC09_009709 [Ceratobasidium sp. 395]|nr:hypothetical protein FRC09_009709 [Ceratobasidium sp. 395]
MDHVLQSFCCALYSPPKHYKAETKKIKVEKGTEAAKSASSESYVCKIQAQSANVIPRTEKKAVKKQTSKAKSVTVDKDDDDEVQEITKPLTTPRHEVASTISSMHPSPNVQQAQLPAQQPRMRPRAKSTAAKDWASMSARAASTAPAQSMNPQLSYWGASTTANSLFMVPSALKLLMEPTSTAAESAAGTSATNLTEAHRAYSPELLWHR